MFQIKLSMKRILKRIDGADDAEIIEIMKALIYWQRTRYPDQELVIMSLPRYDREARFRQLDLMAQTLKAYMYTEAEGKTVWTSQ